MLSPKRKKKKKKEKKEKKKKNQPTNQKTITYNFAAFRYSDISFSGFVGTRPNSRRAARQKKPSRSPKSALLRAKFSFSSSEAK
jgi:hypothetical protein